MCVWPGVPVELQVSAGGDTGVLLAGSRTLVTVDVVSASRSRFNESVVLVQSVPASSLGSLSCRKIVPHWVGTGSPGTACRDTADKAVS